MCGACAMAAAAGASGARSWLQTYGASWLTPRRLRAVTIALMAAALAVSTIGLSGSARSTPRSQAALAVSTTGLSGSARSTPRSQAAPASSDVR